MKLWRAANDDSHSDNTSFARNRDVAEAYLDNRGFGGARLWRLDVEPVPSTVLDLFDLSDGAAVARILEIVGAKAARSAVGETPDVVAPGVSLSLREAGIEWVRVRDTYPVGAETWIFVGRWLDDVEEV